MSSRDYRNLHSKLSENTFYYTNPAQAKVNENLWRNSLKTPNEISKKKKKDPID